MITSNIKKYKNDVEEIIEFITSFQKKVILEKKDYKLALNSITEFITNEEYRNGRANYILENVDCNTQLRNALYCNHYINNVRNSIDNSNSMKMVDLFCGAGGLSLGFTQEGFVSVLANDIQECCVDTYSHNHPETPYTNILLGDINEIIPNIVKLTDNQQIDIVVGGPPCQGFSIANRQRLIDDPRNHL